ncbi:alpha-L-fucosidase [Aestuariimicrobium sp. T2.26MG-19.2B]|uniref:alpha-L-fucosidase n=1 Tax=Aestuariimicrobium sp. T2.26MG-19.2B TaxID=3040679 RepID=UPI00247737C1|nr:alpha-L-fucosidase [Aestuariimicrobium sp. T2.26MG-19.2B]CAI9403222.1 hypothetical protein AESSP_00961 [Aestuariimicrobium sp. T2.26MG-19.2B]
MSSSAPASPTHAPTSSVAAFDARYHERFARSQWWRDARFGMFIHWGAYAVPARGEWVRSIERISKEDYEASIDAFTPDGVDFGAWADLAKAAGMQYAVMTAKHHDGYALFDSAVSDYTTAKRGPRRDFVREYLDAFRSRGLKVGLYFSVIDWYRSDFPHFGDRQHPERDNEDFRDHQPDLESYRQFMHAQIRELCANYGRLDVMWFDFSYPGMTGEQWGAEELVAMVRELQPDIILDNRLEVSGEGKGTIVTDHPSSYAGDFVSPEQIVPPTGMTCDDGTLVPWESCLTLNNNWGFHADDHDWKSSTTVVRQLVECVAKNGNLLLNVGPDAEGTIPAESQRILREVGEWMDVNAESVRGCGSADLPKPDWGWYTRNHADGRVFAHVLEQPIGPVALTGIAPAAVAGVRVLATGEERGLSKSWTTSNYPDVSFVSLRDPEEHTFPLPDPKDTVLEVRLKD